MLRKFLSLLLILLLTDAAVAAKKVLAIDSWQTQNQIPVYFTATPLIPILDIQITWAAGSARDGQHNGVAYLTNKILAENITNYCDAHLETAGIATASRINQDAATIHLRTTTQPAALKALVQVLAKNFSQPEFSTATLEKNKRQVSDKILKSAQSPSITAIQTLYQNVYADHPYSMSPSGNLDTIKTISQPVVQDFFHQYYGASNALISMVGAITPVQAKQIAEVISTHLSQGKIAPPLPIPLASHSKTGLTFVQFKNATQSHIVMGTLIVAPSDADYFALLVGNHILGVGSTTSYLGKEIRVKRALSYKIFSSLIPHATKGLFIVGLQSRTRKADVARAQTRNLLAKFIQQGPSDAQVKMAQNFLIGNQPLVFNNNKKIVNKLTYLGFYKLPLDYFETYNQHIKQVTAKQIKAAFQKHIKLDELVIVVVGHKQ